METDPTGPWPPDPGTPTPVPDPGVPTPVPDPGVPTPLPDPGADPYDPVSPTA